MRTNRTTTQPQRSAGDFASAVASLDDAAREARSRPARRAAPATRPARASTSPALDRAAIVARARASIAAREAARQAADDALYLEAWGQPRR